MGEAIPELLGLTISESIGFAAGLAVAPAVRPWIQDYANEAWKLHAVKPLDVKDAAEIAAQYRTFEDRARSEAHKQGIDPALMDNLILAMREAPAVEALLALWRRGLVDEPTVDFGLGKLKIAERFRAPIKETKNVLLSPADLAMMRQQGFIDVARQHSESALQGVTNERADLLFEVSGLPPPTERAMEMLRRGIIDEAEFRQIVREGHEKTKYTDEELALRHPVLSASEAARLRLKGWITAAESYTLGERTGYTQEEMDRIYLAMGRPAAPQQMQTAWARGVDGPDGRPMDQAQFQKGIQESDIRPEWGPMLWGIRYAYPPLFQLNRLVLAGAVDAATAGDWAKKQRYHPDVLAALAKFWAQAPAAAGDSHVGKAESQLWTTTHRSFIAFESNVTQARAALRLLNVPAAAQDQIMLYWQAERDLIRRQLTPAQVKKAYSKPVRNLATGANWTRQDAITALVERGYSLDDANTFLDE